MNDLMVCTEQLLCKHKRDTTTVCPLSTMNCCLLKITNLMVCTEKIWRSMNGILLSPENHELLLAEDNQSHARLYRTNIVLAKTWDTRTNQAVPR